MKKENWPGCSECYRYDKRAIPSLSKCEECLKKEHPNVTDDTILMPFATVEVAESLQSELGGPGREALIARICAAAGISQHQVRGTASPYLMAKDLTLGMIKALDGLVEIKRVRRDNGVNLA